MRAGLTLLVIMVTLGTILFAQTDSLRDAAIERTKQQADSASFSIYNHLGATETKKEAKIPIFGKNEEGRLQLNLKIPGREHISWKIPKIIYVGPSEFPDPDVSWQRSLVIPGWGQVYNGDSWKLPILYAGYAATGWYYYDRQRAYQNYRRAYRVNVIFEQTGEAISEADQAFLISEELDQTTTDGLLRQRDQIRKQRDFAMLYIGAWHIINVIESYIGGHMKSVDITEDISMRIRPDFIPLPQQGGALGLGLAIQF